MTPGSFFITDTQPLETETGIYQMSLVLLSYVVASGASYIALVMAQMLAQAPTRQEKRWIHWGGAFAMGAGIWSMHFIGMLSYRMRMEVTYDPWITLLSMVIAIIASWGALGIVGRDRLPRRRLVISSILMGIGICSMHYTGMAAMRMEADLRYTPGIFALSFLIAIAASFAALWMAFTLAQSAVRRRRPYQVTAALVMGAGICGMHYTGMASAVIIPKAGCRFVPNQDFDALAGAIAVATGLIFCIALAAAAYRRAQAEDMVLRSETRLRAVIDGALDAVAIIDQDDRIIDWNKQAELIFGWPRGDVMGRQLANTVILPQYRQMHYDGVREFLKTGTCPYIDRRVEIEALRSDGQTFPIEVSVTAQRVNNEYQFTVFARDITDRRLAEKNKALLAAIVEYSDDAMVTNALDGAITSWNAAAQRLYGYTAAEVLGRNISFIIPEELRSEELSIMEQISQGKSIEHFETERVRKDGEHVAISLTISPIFDRRGRIVGASKVARDITERKAAEVELMRYMKALERSNQELDDFAHIASHDMREPLRGLVIQANFLAEDYAGKLDEQFTHRLQRLTQLSQRMEKLVAELLYFSQLGRAELAVRETDLNPVIDDIRQMLEQFLKDRNGYVTVPKPLPVLVCDKLRVTEALRNLITNAIKYNDKPERVAEVGFLEEAEGPQGPEYNVYYVRDNGVGISREHHEEVFRIFRRLSQKDERETGTGVGLTFVKKIIERHMGRIWLESTPGNGTTFYFTIGELVPASH